MAKKADPATPGTDTDTTVPAADELVDLVARLENGQVGLEESMDLWARGEALAAHCATWLDAAEARITAGD